MAQQLDLADSLDRISQLLATAHASEPDWKNSYIRDAQVMIERLRKSRYPITIRKIAS